MSSGVSRKFCCQSGQLQGAPRQLGRLQGRFPQTTEDLSRIRARRQRRHRENLLCPSNPLITVQMPAQCIQPERRSVGLEQSKCTPIARRPRANRLDRAQPVEPADHCVAGCCIGGSVGAIGHCYRLLALCCDVGVAGFGHIGWLRCDDGGATAAGFGAVAVQANLQRSPLPRATTPIAHRNRIAHRLPREPPQQNEKPPLNRSEAVFHLGVADGTRTRDSQDHNLVLYQLNYSHHHRVLRLANSSRLRVSRPNRCPALVRRSHPSLPPSRRSRW